jgi:hypothetical protein
MSTYSNPCSSYFTPSLTQDHLSLTRWRSLLNSEIYYNWFVYFYFRKFQRLFTKKLKCWNYSLRFTLFFFFKL